MSGYTSPNQIRPFQLPDIAGIANAMSSQSLNAMREDQLLLQSQQLRGAETERGNLRALFSRPDFDPMAPGSAREILQVAPTTGPATFNALMRARADQRAGDASARAGAASDRAAALAGAELAAKNFRHAQQVLVGIGAMPAEQQQAAWDAWRARTEATVPGARGNIPTAFSPEAYAKMLSTAEQIAADAAARARTQDPARERRITDIMETQGVDRRTAQSLVDNIVRPVTDPVTGQHSLVDMLQGQVRVLTPGAPAAPAPSAGATPTAAAPSAGAAPTAPAPSAGAAAAPPRTLYELATTPFTTGAFPALAAGAQSVLGQVGADVVSPEFTERRQAFSNSQGELIRSLAVNPRFPVAEMERIRRELNIEPGVFTDPQTLVARLRSVDTSLRIRLANEARAAANTSLPAETRRNAATAANDIQNFLASLGVPSTPPAPQTAAPNQRPMARAQNEITEGRTATGPNGQRIVFRGGQWVPMQ